MQLSEALAYVNSLDLDKASLDFSKFTDEQLLKTSITADLISLDEVEAFQLELENRNLTEKYFSMRK